MSSLQILLTTGFLCWLVICGIAVFVRRKSSGAWRTIIGLSLGMAAFTAFHARFQASEESSPLITFLTESTGLPLLVLMFSIAVEFSVARTSRLVFFALVGVLGLFQFDMVDILLLSIALAIDVELHEEDWKRGFAGAVVGIATLWATIYFLNDVLALTNASLVFAAAIFCFVHGLCFVGEETSVAVKGAS